MTLGAPGWRPPVWRLLFMLLRDRPWFVTL
jgi:hypothetical protein